jgi:hypothetical protein
MGEELQLFEQTVKNCKIYVRLEQKRPRSAVFLCLYIPYIFLTTKGVFV